MYLQNVKAYFLLCVLCFCLCDFGHCLPTLSGADWQDLKSQLKFAEDDELFDLAAATDMKVTSSEIAGIPGMEWKDGKWHFQGEPVKSIVGENGESIYKRNKNSDYGENTSPEKNNGFQEDLTKIAFYKTKNGRRTEISKEDYRKKTKLSDADLEKNLKKLIQHSRNDHELDSAEYDEDITLLNAIKEKQPIRRVKKIKSLKEIKNLKEIKRKIAEEFIKKHRLKNLIHTGLADIEEEAEEQEEHSEIIEDPIHFDSLEVQVDGIRYLHPPSPEVKVDGIGYLTIYPPGPEVLVDPIRYMSTEIHDDPAKIKNYNDETDNETNDIASENPVLKKLSDEINEEESAIDSLIRAKNKAENDCKVLRIALNKHNALKKKKIEEFEDFKEEILDGNMEQDALSTSVPKENDDITDIKHMQPIKNMQEIKSISKVKNVQSVRNIYALTDSQAKLLKQMLRKPAAILPPPHLQLN